MDLSRNWDQPQLLPALEETDLADLYRWLATQFPYENDVWIEGAHFVDTREQVQSWREQVLDHLVNRGTAAAVRAVAVIADEQPQRPWLRRRLLDAEEQQRQLTWTPPDPAQLRQLVANRSRRYLRHSADLLDVAAAVLTEIERDSLQGLTPIARLLWNETRTGTQTAWRPKLEADLSDFLADQLRLRIADRGIIVNREVEIQRISSYGVGERVDLLVQALSSPSDPPTEHIAVVIEVKGNWNDDLLTAMHTQLADDYLPTIGTSHGIYLVGWFPPGQWDQTDRRRAKAARHTAEHLTEELGRQAAQLRADCGFSIQPILLDLGRPKK
jgi:hypothetical protein